MSSCRMLLTGVLLVGLATSAVAFQGDSNRGKRIYMERCAMCHGSDGRGNNGMAPDFREEWHRLGKSDEELAENIRNGMRTPGKYYDSGPKPPQAIDDRDLEDVLAYLRRAFLY